MRRFSTLCLISCLLLIGCGPPEVTRNESSRIYSQSFKTDICWIALEWNGRPNGWGSCFLANKEKGAFYTNKHVSNMFNSLGRGSHKIFFNGKVYNSEIVRTPLLTDAALIRITDPFNPAEFPEARKISEQEAIVGDKLFLEGFHVHPYRIRELDEADGYIFPLIRILQGYYGFSTLDLDREQEVIYEKLDGRVERLDVTSRELMEKCGFNPNTPDFVENIRNETNLHIQVKVSKDHRFSFGGLSGSPAMNARGEIVGITTLQDICRVDWYDIGNGLMLGKEVFDTVFITPISPVKDLNLYLK